MRLNPNEQGSKFQYHNASQFALKNQSAIAKRQAQMVHRVEKVVAEKAGQSLNQPAYTLDDSLKQMLRQLQAENVKEELQTDAGPMETALLENDAGLLADGEESAYIPTEKVDLVDAGMPTVALQDMEGMEELIEIVGGLKRPDDYKPEFTYESTPNGRVESVACPLFSFADMLALREIDRKYNTGFTVISAKFAQMREDVESFDWSEYGEEKKAAALSEINNALNDAISSLFVKNDMVMQMNDANANAFDICAKRFEEMFAMINSKVGIDYDEKVRDFLLEGLKNTFKDTVERFSQRHGFNVTTSRVEDEKKFELEYIKAEKQMKAMKEKVAQAMNMIDWTSANSVKASLVKAYGIFN